MRAAKLTTVLSVFIFMVASIAMSSLASAQDNEKNLGHMALANQYKDLAQEMLTKAEGKKAVLVNKPSSSYFGKTGMRQKERLKNMIFKYEETADEYSQQAIYHQKMAVEQINGKSIATLNQVNEQIYKDSL